MATILGMLSYRCEDSLGVRVPKELFFTAADTVTLANVAAFSAAYAPLLDLITNDKIIQCKFEMQIALSGLKSSANVGNTNNDYLLTDHAQSGSFYHWGDDVPALNDVLIVDEKIDNSNTDLINYTTFLDTSHSGFTPSGRYGNALVAWIESSKRDRKQRKQVAQRTRVVQNP